MERFRRHLAEYVSQKQTGASYGDCSDSGVTYSPRAEEERAGCSDVIESRTHAPFYSLTSVRNMHLLHVF